MKKAYETPKAEKVNFDYTQNVVASGTSTPNNTKCIDPCYVEPTFGGYRPCK